MMGKGGGLFDQDFNKASKQIKKKDSLLTTEEEFIGLSKETLELMNNDSALETVETKLNKTKLTETKSLLESASTPRRGLL